MRPISLHVDEDDYRRFKALAEGQGRPVAELIREAMRNHLEQAEKRASNRSLRDLEPIASGPMLRPWRRDEIYDEMIDYPFEIHEAPSEPGESRESDEPGKG